VEQQRLVTHYDLECREGLHARASDSPCHTIAWPLSFLSAVAFDIQNLTFLSSRQPGWKSFSILATCVRGMQALLHLHTAYIKGSF
jgi:hypothetical protein